MCTEIMLYYYKNMPVLENVCAQECRGGTVKSRLFTARRNLQKAMGHENDLEGVRV